MNTTRENPNTVGCHTCGHTELPSPSGLTDNVARFLNADDRTDRCLKQVGVSVAIGTEVRMCRKHAVALEQALTIEYGSACPYVQPVPRTSPSVGVDTRPQRAMLTTWVGDSFLPDATLGPVFRLFGQHRAHRVSVVFEGRRFEGVWLPDCQDFVRLKAAP